MFFITRKDFVCEPGNKKDCQNPEYKTFSIWKNATIFTLTAFVFFLTSAFITYMNLPGNVKDAGI